MVIKRFVDLQPETFTDTTNIFVEDFKYAQEPSNKKTAFVIMQNLFLLRMERGERNFKVKFQYVATQNILRGVCESVYTGFLVCVCGRTLIFHPAINLYFHENQEEKHMHEVSRIFSMQSKGHSQSVQS